MKKEVESKEDRAKRKAMYIARGTAHFDTPKIRKELSDKFEKENKN